jgi:hypothetical protein
MGFFNASKPFYRPGPGGLSVPAPRVLDFSDNQLSGKWPVWFLSSVPAVQQGCDCPVYIKVNGDDMRLECPWPTNVTDYYWQVASTAQYSCWDGSEARQVTDFLASPSNELAPDLHMAVAPPEGSTAERSGISPGQAAGIAIGLFAGLAMLIGLAVIVKRTVDKLRYQPYSDEKVQQAAPASTEARRDLLQQEAAISGGGAR